MQLIVYSDVANPLALANPQILEGFTSVSWIERYRAAGEFVVTAPLSSRVGEFMPVGSLVTHINTLELMMVENVTYRESISEDPVIELSGRSLEAWLENRIVGMTQAWQTPTPEPKEVTLPAYSTWDQAYTLIRMHITTAGGAYASSVVPGLDASVVQPVPVPPGAIAEARLLARKSVYEHLLDILAIDDFGIKVVRKGAPGQSTTTTYLVVHNGVDRTNAVRFSTVDSTLKSSESVLTNQLSKNVALATSKFEEMIVNPPVGPVPTGWLRRETWLDGKDIDNDITETPPLGDPSRTTIRNWLGVRGRAEIANKRNVAITATEIGEEPYFRFRRHYDVGDKVLVKTALGMTQKMRVIEYAEIVDENGYSGLPTLEVLEDA
jgi:Siphovirus ReqiPepy6 Gp37-like protein